MHNIYALQLTTRYFLMRSELHITDYFTIKSMQNDHNINILKYEFPNVKAIY
jgi:hypothetical protein